MKYGKRFLAEQSSLGTLYLLDYKCLKKQLKKRSSSRRSSKETAGEGNQAEGVEPPRSPHYKNATVWKAQLFEQMDRVDRSFQDQELRLMVQLHHIIEKHGDEGLLLDEAQPLLREVTSLRKHAILNTYACFKITKKHDKLHHRAPPLRQDMLSQLCKKRFAKSLSSSLLFERCEEHMTYSLSDDLLCVSVRMMLSGAMPAAAPFTAAAPLPPADKSPASSPPSSSPPLQTDGVTPIIVANGTKSVASCDVPDVPPTRVSRTAVVADALAAKRASKRLSSSIGNLAVAPIRVIGRRSASADEMGSQLDALMALNRVQSFLSNERTLLAWVRTSLAFFGLAVGLVNVDLDTDNVSAIWASALALFVGVLAVGAYVEGLIRHGELKRALQLTEFHLYRSHSLWPFWQAVSCAFAATIAYSAYHIWQVATVYQQWQSRIMYFHFVKQRKADGPCTDMTGFTRLVASENGEPDGLEGEVPSAFVRQYTTAEIAQYGHFGVLNRPFSVVQFIQNGGFERIKEPHVWIAETDHVLMRPLPNLAHDDGRAAAFSFGYMHASYGHQSLIDRFAPGVKYSDVQPVGPSPLMISKSKLELLAPEWLNMSLRLKVDKTADQRFGWVLEMWGYSIAAAARGIRHDVLRNFQVEGGAGISALSAQSRGTYIFHYTYGIEYTLGGRPQGPNQIGEWSLDKRHYGAAYPPRGLQPPPSGASDGARWLLDAFNEASAGIATWPSTKAIGTVGWRRVAGDGISSSKLAQRVAGSKWTWAGIKGMSFNAGGALTTPWGSGVWGCLPSGVDYHDDGFCKAGCLFADFGSALHNLRFDTEASPWTFDSYRLGDGAHVPGVKQD